MKKAHIIIENQLVDSILTGASLPGDLLPGDRELALKYGVARPVVREALQNMAHSGWISINTRKASLVNNYWSDGTLDILASIAKSSEKFPIELIADLLEVRAELAPDYAAKAIEKDSAQVIACLAKARKLGTSGAAFAKFDWELHRMLSILSGNRIYPLILNSFANLYFKMRGQFFSAEDYREISRVYYQKLLKAAIDENIQDARQITRTAMLQRVHLFRRQIEARKNEPREEDTP